MNKIYLSRVPDWGKWPVVILSLLLFKEFLFHDLRVTTAFILFMSLNSLIFCISPCLISVFKPWIKFTIFLFEEEISTSALWRLNMQLLVFDLLLFWTYFHGSWLFFEIAYAMSEITLSRLDSSSYFYLKNSIVFFISCNSYILQFPRRKLNILLSRNWETADGGSLQTPKTRSKVFFLLALREHPLHYFDLFPNRPFTASLTAWGSKQTIC